MAAYAVTDLTFAITKQLGKRGGLRNYREVYGTILIPAGALTYAAGGVPISGITSTTTMLTVAGTGLACAELGFPNEMVELEVLGNGLAASLDDAFVVYFDSGALADGTTPTTTHKLRIMKASVPTITTWTAAGATFAGSALAAHRHVLFLNNADQTDGVTTDVNAATNKVGCNTTVDISVAGTADTATHGGVVDITAGTPAGTNAAADVTGTTAVPVRWIEHASGAIAETLTVYVYAAGW